MSGKPHVADRLVWVGAAHSIAAPGETYRALALRGGVIVAVSRESDGLDDLGVPEADVVDLGDLTVLPAFADAHEHLLEASRNTVLVPVDRARSIGEFTAIVADAVAPRRGTLQPGYLADFVAYEEDPISVDVDALAELTPLVTVVGGRVTHDPQKRFSTSAARFGVFR
jgi:predicted amidohydrolase YtcJ